MTRTLKVKTTTDEYEGVLTAANDVEITLEWKAREPKPIGKGKHTVEKKVIVSYDAIVEAKVKIIF